MQQNTVKGEIPDNPLSWLGGYLTSPSFYGVTPAPGYMTKTDDQTEAAAMTRDRQAIVGKLAAEVRNGADKNEVRKRAVAAGLRPSDITYIMRADHPKQQKALPSKPPQ